MSEERQRDPPAVVDGKLLRLSVSQMQKADAESGGCLRAWRLSKVEKPFPEPEGAGQRKGKAGHRRLERYLRGEPNAAAELEHLELVGVHRGLVPAPGPGLLVEHAIWPDGGKPLLHALGVPLAGYVDLIDLRGLVGGLLRVVDWKYKKPWNGKTGDAAADLVNPRHGAGIQMLGYAEALRNSGYAYSEIELSHVTFRTAGVPDVFPAVARMQREESAPLWEGISARIVPKMHAAAAAAHALDVEPNLKRCDLYRGCPYKPFCFDPKARIAAGFRKLALKEGSMGLASSLGIASTPASPPAAPPSVPTPAAPTAGTAKPGTLYIVRAQKARYLCNTSFGAEIYASFAPAAGGPPLLVPTTEPVTELPPDGPPLVLPPDAPASDPALAARPAPGTMPPAAPTTPAPQPAAPQAAVPAPEAAAPKPRGRPRKLQVQPDGSVPPPAAAGAPEAVPEGDSGLYLNCSPMGVATQSLHAYVEGLQTELYRQAQLPDAFDLRAARDEVFGFGRWKGFLATAVREMPPKPGHYVVATGGDERVDCVAQALIASGWAPTVVA